MLRRHRSPGVEGRPPTPPSEAVEDYVCAVLRTGRGPGGVASTTEVAGFLAVAPASVSGMFKRLARLGLVVHEPYRGVRLTDEGRRLAMRVSRRHELLEAFFREALGMPGELARAEADRLEHHVSPHLEELLAAHVDPARTDPGARDGGRSRRARAPGTPAQPSGT